MADKEETKPAAGAAAKPAGAGGPNKRGVVAALAASFNQPAEEPVRFRARSAAPSAMRGESSAAGKSLASSTRTERPPLPLPKKPEPAKKEESKPETPKKEEPKKPETPKKEEPKKQESPKKEEPPKKPETPSKEEPKVEPKKDVPPKKEASKKDLKKKDEKKDKEKKEHHKTDSSDGSRHHHHHSKRSKSPDGQHDPSKAKNLESLRGSVSCDSIATMVGNASSASSLRESTSSTTESQVTQVKKPEDASSEVSEDAKGDDNKSESTEGSGRERLSKRLGSKRKTIFNSLNFKAWRKSKAPSTAEDGSGDTPSFEEEEGSEMDSSTPDEEAIRRAKHKSIFSKHGSKRDAEPETFEITRRASVASVAEERSVSFVVKRPPAGEESSAGGEEASLQRCVSMYSFDQSASGMSDDEDDGEPLDKEEKMRRHVLREILVTEESYVKDLRIIVDVIIPNMKSKKVLDQTQINGIFSGVEVLLNFNNFLLKKLQDGEPVGKSFEGIASFLKGYVQYCVNVPKAEEKLKQYAKDSSFRNFLAEISTLPEMHQLGVSDFLMKPVQRLCKYPLLLRELISHTPKDSPDYPSLNNAYNEIQKTVAAVNEGKRADEDHQKVITIFEKLDGFNDRAKFITPSRSYIHEETLKELLSNGTEQEMHYIFFNDLILRVKQHAGRYSLKSFITRDVLLVTPVTSPIETRKLSSSGKPYFLLDVVHAGVDKYTIICESEQDRSRILEIASGNTGNGNNYTRSTKDLIELYHLQPKTKIAPMADASEPPGTVVFCVYSQSYGDLARYVSIDKNSHSWKDVTARISRKFGVPADKSFVLCQHGKSDVVVKTIDKLCEIVNNVTDDPQFDLLTEDDKK